MIMQIQIESGHSTGGTVVGLNGKLDSGNAMPVEIALLEVIAKGETNLKIDCKQLTFVSSAGPRTADKCQLFAVDFKVCLALCDHFQERNFHWHCIPRVQFPIQPNNSSAGGMSRFDLNLHNHQFLINLGSCRVLLEKLKAVDPIHTCAVTVSKIIYQCTCVPSSTSE